MNDSERNGLQEIIDNALDDMAREASDSFDAENVNLAELSRKTGLTRSRLRTLKARGVQGPAARPLRQEGGDHRHERLRGRRRRDVVRRRHQLGSRLRAHRGPGLRRREDHREELHSRAHVLMPI